MPNRRPVHRAMGTQIIVERRRLSGPGRGYDWRWKKLRAKYLAEHPVCECGCGRPARVVDHKKPHGGDPALLYAWDNLEAMTKPCHDRKTAARDGGFGNPVKPAGPITYTVTSGADVWPRLGDLWPGLGGENLGGKR